MSLVSLQIDGKQVQAEQGRRLLSVILENELWVPNLCAIDGLEPPRGDCRLCWVEVEGWKRPVTACTTRVEAGLVVHTQSEAVDQLVRAGFELLMSTHRLDCKKCPGHRRCALQQIANRRKLSLRPKRLPKIEPDFPLDESRDALGINPNHCILCGKCVHACEFDVHKGILAFAQRGLATQVSTFDGAPLAEQGCGDCTRCAEVCPVGAIYLRG